MKLLTFTLVFFTSFISFSQTNVISARSHSGDISDAFKEPDNFGLPPMQTKVDTVILYNENCLIEIKTTSHFDDMPSGHYRDTTCNHPYLEGLGTNLREIKKRYPANTVFIGFKRSGDAQRNENQNNNNTIILGILLLSGLITYVSWPALKI